MNPFSRRRTARPIQLALIAVTFIAITVISVLLSFVVVEVQSAVRAYVAGEGYWSKAQRDASFVLYRYGQTGDPGYLRRFEEAIKIPLGDRMARIELLKEEYDYAVAERGLLDGATHPDDIPLVIRLFRCCHRVHYMQQIIGHWTEGDRLILELQGIAAELRAEFESQSPSSARISNLLVQVQRNNDEVRPMEQAFTEALGAAARWVSSLLILFAAAVVLLLISIGSWLIIRTLRSIRQSEMQYQSLMQSASAGLFVTDVTSDRVLEVNRRAEQMTGRPADDLIGTFYDELFAQPDPDEPERLEHSPVATRRLRAAGGDVVEVEVTRSPTNWYGRKAQLSVVHDISDRLRIERQLRIATNAIANMSEAVFITDERFKIISVNQAFTTITGYDPAEVVGLRPLAVEGKGWTIRNIGIRFILRSLQSDGRWQGELMSQRKNGHLYPQLLSIAAVREAGGRVKNYVGIFTDNSAFRDYERRLRHVADHDMLTDLPNRAAFEEKSARMVRSARAAGAELALLFVDLDGFKQVNDTYGHAAGDHVLRIIGSRIRNSLREGDLVGRVGGDEFNVLIGSAPADGQVSDLARTVLRVVSEPVTYEGHELSLSASIGISFFPRDASDFDGLVACADVAMYEAKRRGRNNVQVFSTGTSAAARTRQHVANGLRQAIDQQQFQLCYLPQVELATGRVVGFEALLRWHHPELGWTAPPAFIPLAEEIGLSDALSDWVLRTACAQGAAWRSRGLGDIPISVNLSPRSFWDRELSGRIKGTLEETGWPASLLCLEITEAALMAGDDPQEATDRIRALGVRLALDDFGVGYSSLGNLRRLSLDVLKFDRSFTSGIPTDADDVALIRTILALTRGLDVTVVAEGIESAAQRDALLAEGCRYGQGYLFGWPAAPEACEGILRAGRIQAAEGQPLSV